MGVRRVGLVELLRALSLGRSWSSGTTISIIRASVWNLALPLRT